jgi:hypothetical protein
MKKIMLCVMVTFMLLAFYPNESKAATEPTPTSLAIEKPVESARVKVLLLRLDQIKAMDKSNLKSSEKKVLRKEVRAIKQELQTMGPYVYVSVGAAVLIILLIVILL